MVGAVAAGSEAESPGCASRDCLFVANLPSSFSDDELEHHLRALFATYGPIRSTKAGRDRKMRPFCFVQFEAALDDAVFGVPHYLGGRPLRIERSRVKTAPRRDGPRPAEHYPLHGAYYGPPGFYDAPQAAVQPVYALQVSGLDAGAMRRSLVFQRFKRYGYVVGIDLDYGPPDAPSSNAGRAFVYYTTFDAVRRAVAGAHGREFLGGAADCAFVPSMAVPVLPAGGFPMGAEAEAEHYGAFLFAPHDASHADA